PSTIAAAREFRMTWMLGAVLSPPALMRRIYCGRRKIPCPSAPERSEAAINSAARSASGPAMPTPRQAAAMTRVSFRPASRLPAGLLGLADGKVLGETEERLFHFFRIGGGDELRLLGVAVVVRHRLPLMIQHCGGAITGAMPRLCQGGVIAPPPYHPSVGRAS